MRLTLVNLEAQKEVHKPNQYRSTYIDKFNHILYIDLFKYNNIVNKIMKYVTKCTVNKYE